MAQLLNFYGIIYNCVLYLKKIDIFMLMDDILNIYFDFMCIIHGFILFVLKH